ncbi:MAG: ABC transporter substrate-binding protein [Clostridium sp.]
MMFKKKSLSVILTVIMAMFILASCGSSTVKVKDREGREVSVPTKVEKIVSTAPSNTEVLVALGLGEKIVAVDKYSENVDGISKDIPKIDFMNPDAETLISLKPDVIVASGHNKTESGQDPFKAIEEAGIAVVYVPSSDSINGIYEDIKFMAGITGTEKKGDEVISSMKKEIEDIRESVKSNPKKKVYFEIGSQPNLFSFGSGTFLNEMIEIVGGENILKNQKSWIAPSEESVIKANPDVIFTNEGYIKDAPEAIKKRKGWENVSAIKNGKVFMIDQDSASRPSQNIIKALKEMANAMK